VCTRVYPIPVALSALWLAWGRLEWAQVNTFSKSLPERSRNGRAGFTLIELIVVIAILAILLSILFPMGHRMIEVARNSQCKSNLHQWGMLWQAYCATNDGWARGEWAKALLPYVGDKTSLLICPEATKRNPKSPGATVYWAWGSTKHTYVHGRTNGEVVARDSSYGFNCWMFDPPFWLDHNGNRKPDLPAEEVTEIQNRPAQHHWRRVTAIPEDTHWIPVILDSMWRGGGPDHAKATAIQTPAYNGEWISANREMMHFAMDRHQGGVNGVFADTSVRHIPVKQLWRLKWNREYNMHIRDSISWPTWINKLEKQFPEVYDF